MKIIERFELRQGEETIRGLATVAPHFFRTSLWKHLTEIPEVKAWLVYKRWFNESILPVLLSKSTTYHAMINEMSRLAFPTGRTFLALGDGTGEISCILSTGPHKKPSTVYFMSDDWRCCAKARERLDGSGFKRWMGLIVAEPVTFMPVRSNSVDTIVANFVVNWLPLWFDEDGIRYEGEKATRLMLTDLHRMLKPGGRLIFSVLHPETRLISLWRDMAASIFKRYHPINLVGTLAAQRPKHPMLYQAFKYIIDKPYQDRLPSLHMWREYLHDAGLSGIDVQSCLERQGFIITAKKAY